MGSHVKCAREVAKLLVEHAPLDETKRSLLKFPVFTGGTLVNRNVVEAVPVKGFSREGFKAFCEHIAEHAAQKHGVSFKAEFVLRRLSESALPASHPSGPVAVPRRFTPNLRITFSPPREG